MTMMGDGHSDVQDSHINVTEDVLNLYIPIIEYTLAPV